MMELTLRQTLSKDMPVVRKMLRPWVEQDPLVAEILSPSASSGLLEKTHCTLLETDRTIRAVALWIAAQANEVRLLALAAAPGAAEWGGDVRLLQQEIIEWTEMGISRATIELPQALSPSIIKCLTGCGFFFEGICSGCNLGESPRIRLSKHFLYRTVPHEDVMDFLREFMISLGYEVRPQEDGFSYRLREDFRFPFIFSQWHRISASGPDIVLRPPARVLPYYELETLFYPLRISSEDERPLLVAMDKKKAGQLIDLPRTDPRQKGLFEGSAEGTERHAGLNTIVYSYPAGKKPIRKGMPILFYVNKIGAVGAARVEDSQLEDPANLSRQFEEMGLDLAEEMREHGAGLDGKAPKVLVVRFQWYRPLRKAASLEEIRHLDVTFNPQRTRSISQKLFDAIIALGTAAD
jgi:hypothetical protein